MFNGYGLTRFILVVLISFITFKNYANSNSSHMESFFYLLYNYQFKSADSVLKIIEKKESDKKLLSILQVTFMWQQLLSGYDDKKSIEDCLKLTEKAISEQIDSYNNNNTCNYYLILLYGYKARISNMLGKKVVGTKAFFDGVKYLDLLDTCSLMNKEIFRLTGGMYYCLIGYAYESHPYLFLFNSYSKYANKRTGYKLLMEGANSNLYFIQVECLYFLVKLNCEIESNIDLSKVYLDQLLTKAPDNLLFNYYSVQLLQMQGNSKQVKEGMQRIKSLVNKNDELDQCQKQHFLKLTL